MRVSWSDITALGLIALSIIFLSYASWCQLGITYDSRDYLHAAQTWLKSGTLYNANGQIYVERTPLYPIILSWGGMQWAKFIQFFSLTMSLWLWYKLTSTTFQSTKFGLLFLASLSLATPILLIHSFLWSEAFFLFLLTLLLFLGLKYLQTTQNIYFFALIFIAFWLCLARNTGIFIVFGLAFWVLIEKQSLFKIIFYSFLSLSAWLIWTTYAISLKSFNYHPLYSTLGQDFLINLWELGICASNWILPNQISVYLRLVFFMGLCIIIGFVIIGRRNNFTRINLLIIKALSSILLTYTIAVCIFAQSNGVHEAERYWAVMYPLFFYLFWLAWERLYLDYKNLLFKRFFLCCLLAWLIYPCFRSLKNIHQWHQVNCKELHAINNIQLSN